jgi:F-type H+-transporting ATPase subunit b
MQEVISTFHIDWKLMIAQIINFSLVFLVFYLLAAKPLAKLVKDRTKEIETGLTDAKQNVLLLEKTKKEYEEVLTKARKEANDIFQVGKRDAELKRSQMMEDTKAEMASILASGKKTLEAEKIKMVGDAKREVASLIVQATEKLLGEKVDASYEGKAVKELERIK